MQFSATLVMKKSHPSRRVKQHTAVDISFCRKERMGSPRGEYSVPKNNNHHKAALKFLRTTSFRENTLIA